MKQEKHIKETLKNYESPLNMDAMWESIESDLDKDHKRKGWLIWPIALVGLLILTTGTLVFYSLNNKSLTKMTDPKVQTLIKPESKRIQKTELKTAPVTDNSVTSNNNTNDKIANSTGRKLSLKNNKEQTFLLEKPNSSISSKSSKQNKIQQAEINKKNITTVQKPIATNEIHNSNPIESPVLKLSDLSMDKMFAQIVPPKQLNQLTPSLKMHDRKLIMLSKKQRLIDPSHIPTESNWRVSLFGGQSISYFNEKMAEGILTDWFTAKQAADRSTNNLSFGMQLEKRLANNLKIKSGLQYLNHGQIFSINDTFSDGFIVDTIVQVTANRFTSVTETKVVTSEKISIHEVRHYNQVKTWQIPLMLGIERSKNKFDYSFSAGIAFNYFQAVSGKTFDLIELFIIEKKSLNQDYKSSSLALSGIIELQLGYSLSHKFRLFAGLQGGRIFGNAANNTNSDDLQLTLLTDNFVSKINHFGIQTGISYNF